MPRKHDANTNTDTNTKDETFGKAMERGHFAYAIVTHDDDANPDEYDIGKLGELNGDDALADVICTAASEAADCSPAIAVIVSRDDGGVVGYEYANERSWGVRWFGDERSLREAVKAAGGKVVRSEGGDRR